MPQPSRLFRLFCDAEEDQNADRRDGALQPNDPRPRRIAANRPSLTIRYSDLLSLPAALAHGRDGSSNIVREIQLSIAERLTPFR